MATTPGKATCPHCGGTELYTSVKPVSSGGGYAPDLLPGLHPWYRSGRLHVVICGDCGLCRQFAGEEERARLRGSPKWRRL